jgi:hypothetical protein
VQAAPPDPANPPVTTLAHSASILPTSPTKTLAEPSSRTVTNIRNPHPIAAERVLLAGCLADSLSQFLSEPYQLNASFVPWLLGLQQQDTLASTAISAVHNGIGARRLRSTPLAAAVSLLEAVLEDWELRRALHAATLTLGLQALGASVTATHGGSLSAVSTVATIFSSEGPATTALLGWDDLKDHLERLLVIRKPSDADMAAEMPEVSGRMITVQCLCDCYWVNQLKCMTVLRPHMLFAHSSTALTGAENVALQVVSQTYCKYC